MIKFIAEITAIVLFVMGVWMALGTAVGLIMTGLILFLAVHWPRPKQPPTRRPVIRVEDPSERTS